MENQAKKPIEEIAKNMLIWKVKQKGKLLCSPAKEPRLFSKGIKYLLDKKYISKKIENSKPVYYVTFEGFKYVFSKS